MPLATLIDPDVLWKLIAASFGGGLGATIAFSLVIVGATRSGEQRRAGNMTTAALFLALAILGMAAVIAGIVYGVTILTHKT